MTARDPHNPDSHERFPETTSDAEHDVRSVRDQASALPSPTGGAPIITSASSKQRTLWRDAWHRLRKNKLAIAGLIWIVFILLMTVTADLWVPRLIADPLAPVFDSKLSPSIEHPFGTDKLGRDAFARVVYGARISLSVGLVAVAISLIIGLIMGAVSGYYSGLPDSIVMRTADVFFAFPYILFAIALIAVLGFGLTNLYLAIGILGWPSIARVFRSSILTVKENEYVDAARAMGASDVRIMFRHIMPNSIAPIIVYGTMSIGGAILSEAALSYLGVGVQPPTPSWGLMLSEAKSQMFDAPWLTIWPGIAILTTVLAFVLMGDGLRDALDVKMKD